jgi:hypothetical protein
MLGFILAAVGRTGVMVAMVSARIKVASETERRNVSYGPTNGSKSLILSVWVSRL